MGHITFQKFVFYILFLFTISSFFSLRPKIFTFEKRKIKFGFLLT